ncbi:ATP-binding protein [Pontibacillus sp. ALD_SL1]|nr:ATP-binding protein [Pontibacillus sp. ALD_SL1]
MLRQPHESGRVTISRDQASVTYPAKFLPLSAMNPCPCGYLGATTHYCTCSPKHVQAYQNKVSGPVCSGSNRYHSPSNPSESPARKERRRS